LLRWAGLAVVAAVVMVSPGATAAPAPADGNRSIRVALAASNRSGESSQGPRASFTSPDLEVLVVRSRVASGPRHIAPSRPVPALMVAVPHSMSVTSRPGGGAVVGVLPGSSRYYHVPLVAWVIERSRNSRFGRVPVAYAARPVTGWIPLRGLSRRTTPYRVLVDLSQHRLTVTRLGKPVFRASAATGAPSSPTPSGRYFVTDRVPFARGSSLGSFAFGISGIQPRLPAGWHGGDQLAIHGTNAPWTIGTSASAGCVRVSEGSLATLRPILALGTPVVIRP
jgi:lipoprotein-anchoring transpeptidase ErfK/SrfK